MTTTETLTEFTIKRVSEQDHDPIIAQEEAAADKGPLGGTG